MVFHEKRRARVISVAILLAVALPLTVALADSWGGTRYNGAACNKYFLDDSVFEYGRQQPIRDAIQSWRGISPKVDAGMSEVTGRYGPATPGADKIFIGQTPEEGLYGLTRRYKQVNGIVTEYSVNEPERRFGSWYMATEAIYENQIERRSDELSYDDDERMSFYQDIIAHEIGHSLKLAHGNLNQGTPPRNNIDTNGRRHLVRGGENMKATDLVIEPKSYDREEICAQWKDCP